ncbi:MAG: ankyrin repeat domain-containing protein, partial [Chloroflexi bacterium]|nr:ankyrin repeat domain-containing protein [Chloroflexota bacterium]
MKTKLFANSLFVLLLSAGPAFAATNDLSGALQRGLFEEEANRNLDAAIAAYQSVVTEFDQGRKVAATAVFRLGECYRKLGRTNEAAAQYERVLHEFTDQSPLITLSRQYLLEAGRAIPGAAPAGGALPAIQTVVDPAQAGLLRDEIKLVEQQIVEVQRRIGNGQAESGELRSRQRDRLKLQRQLPENADASRQKALLEAELKLVEENLADLKKRMEVGAAAPIDAVPLQRDVLELQRQILAVSQIAQAGGQSTAGMSGEESQELQRIRTLLAESPDLINAPGKNGETLLQAAAGKGQLEVVQFLLDHGAAVNGTKQPDLTPLHFAAGNGRLAVVDLLLRRGAKVDATAGSGETPLHLAALKGYAQVAKALIEAGAAVNARTKGGPRLSSENLNYALEGAASPLTLALRHGYLSVVELLLAAKADLNERDGQGNTPLLTAVDRGQKTLVEILLDHGADVNGVSQRGVTALASAASQGNLEIVTLLLARKANVNLKDRSGFTPLHSPALAGHKAVVEALLAAGAEVNARSHQGDTPLNMAVLNRHADVVAALLQAKADPNLWNAKGVLPLHTAIGWGDPAIVEDFLEHGSAVESRNPEGWTPLGLAVKLGHTNVMAALLNHGADVNAKSPSETPLQLAVSLNRPDVVSLLLAHKADVNAVNDSVPTALDILKSRLPPGGGKSPQTEMMDLLRAHGALDWPPRPGQITATRRSTGVSVPVFQQGTNLLNRFTLFEVIAALPWGPEALPLPLGQHLGQQRVFLPFPDFTKVTITRRDAKTGKLTEIPVD